MTVINLTDHFTSNTGEFIGYLDASQNPVPTGKHYNLRSFHSDSVTIPSTMINHRNTNISGLNGQTMLELNSPIMFVGSNIPSLQMSQMDVLSMSSLDSNKMVNMEGIVSPGIESWSGTGVTITRDSGQGNINTIQVALTGGVAATATSTYTDDIYTNFKDFSDYEIALQLINFPAQTAPAHLDLNNSFIDFTSDAGYAAGLTDSFAFSATANDITVGGNITWQIPRASLTHVDLTNIIGIRFRLLSVGNMTFEATNMTMYSPSAINENYISIDTKRNWVYKNQGYQTTTGAYGQGQYGSGNYNAGGSVTVNAVTEMILPGSRPKNVTVVTKFNPGVLPTADSTVTLYARQYGFPVSATLTFSSSASALAISDTNGPLYTSGALAALTSNQEYYLVFEAYENKLRLSVWNGTGTFYGSNVFSSGWQTTIAGVGRGYIGFEFNPANYDSYMKYFTVGDSEFARYESKALQRFTNTKGAAIAAVTSPPINLVQGVYGNYGDGTYSTSNTKGHPLPPSLYVQRTGLQWTGGLITTPLFVGNPAYLSISGDIFPVPTGSTINGEYKIVFQNEINQIGYIATLQNVLPNQWNHFEIPFNGILAADEYQVIFEQTGYFADAFYLDNFALNYLTFAWEISPDNGTTFYPFLTAIDDQWKGVNFIENPGKSLIVRGIALTDQSWIQSYELVPIKK